MPKVLLEEEVIVPRLETVFGQAQVTGVRPIKLSRWRRSSQKQLLSTWTPSVLSIS